jgi:hypothetical protein
VDLARGLDTLLVTAVVAAPAPLLVALLSGPRIPPAGMKLRPIEQ